MKLGVLGGTFDPPHLGHLLAASDAYEQLSLDRLLFVPAASQPLKIGRVTATAAQRLEMTRRLVADDSRFEVDPIEIDRTGLSFSVETLTALASRHPGAELFFLVGADVLSSFARWREPERVRQLATMVVLERVGEGIAPPPDIPGDAPMTLRTRRVDMSSTEIRERIRAGKSIHGFVPDSVAAYIAAEGLYR